MKHLKDNRGNMPIWPALIVAAVVTIILFIGFACMFKGINPLDAISDFFGNMGNNIKEFFNPTPSI